MMETNNQEGSPPSRSTQLLMQMMSQLSEQAAATQAAFRQSIETLRTERDADREETRNQIRELQLAIATPQHTTHGEIASPAPQRLGPVPPVLDATSPPIVSTNETSQGQIPTKKPTLPNPQRFDGTRREFRAWLLEMRSKLHVDGPALGGSLDQFVYIYSRLDKTPQAMSAAYFEKGGLDGSSNPEEFLKYLTTCYGDPNIEQRALSRLETMRQGAKEKTDGLQTEQLLFCRSGPS